MNYKRLLFSGMVTATIGLGLGIIVTTLLPTPYSGGLYREHRRGFMIGGGIIGWVMGVSQEAIRQLKEQQDHQ